MRHQGYKILAIGISLGLFVNLGAGCAPEDETASVGGDTASVKSAPAKASPNETVVGETVVGETVVGETVVGETVVGETVVG
ncbi:hypothetical protein, partial [Desulfuromonas sp.]|uniref:hypothetical protein n=1 Tax=Desulfuromonas sp. TaxID=892 RepID=UPI0025BB4F36